nr:reverse transcriptase domain-containing protein [Tanacetum cinerariifolium]
MEPRPDRTREVTPPLHTRSPRVRRQRERIVGFEEAPNKERSRIRRNVEGLSTPPHIPNINTTEIPPVTTTVFAATAPRNTPFTYHASTSTDPAPMINPAFVEANHEIIESFLRDIRRQIRNEDLQT